MELTVLVKELKHGLNNKYDVYVDTLGGFTYQILELLNEQDGTLTAKIERGMIVLEPSAVVSLRKIETFEPRATVL